MQMYMTGIMTLRLNQAENKDIVDSSYGEEDLQLHSDDSSYVTTPRVPNHEKFEKTSTPLQIQEADLVLTCYVKS